MKKNQPPILSRRIFIRSSLSAIGLGTSLSVINHSVGQSIHQLHLQDNDKALPTAPLITAQDTYLSLADLAGSPLIVNFWATWCAPCVVELPHLEIAAVRLKADNIKVLLVGMDRGGSEIGQPFLDTRQITSPLAVYDENAVWWRHLTLRGLPSTLLITADQSRSAIHTGPAEWHHDEIIAQLKAYFA